jgi:large subunit ribosomal protein L17
MIKNLGRRKLSRTGGHRRALLKNLATSLFLHEKITTTLSKAREVASYSERIITAAKGMDLNARRSVASDIQDKTVHKKLFDVLAPRFKERKGGFTKIFKLGNRSGDNAKMAVVKLIS